MASLECNWNFKWSHSDLVSIRWKHTSETLVTTHNELGPICLEPNINKDKQMKNLGHAVDISISNSKHREWALNDNSRTQLDSLQPEIEAIIYTKRSGEAFVTPLSESPVQVSEPSSSSFSSYQRR